MHCAVSSPPATGRAVPGGHAPGPARPVACTLLLTISRNRCPARSRTVPGETPADRRTTTAGPGRPRPGAGGDDPRAPGGDGDGAEVPGADGPGERAAEDECAPLAPVTGWLPQAGRIAAAASAATMPSARSHATVPSSSDHSRSPVRRAEAGAAFRDICAPAGAARRPS